MKAKTYLVERQIAWAKRHGVDLIVSPSDRNEVGDFSGQENRTAYTTTLEANLFEPIGDVARADFEAGDGGELGEKMNALYSSSALACNLFHHLCQPDRHACLKDLVGIKAGTIRSVQFEQKRRVMEKPRSQGFQRDPNLDVMIRMDSPNPVEFAFEVKCREPWSGRPDGIKSRYLEVADFWTSIPNLKAYAERIGIGKQDAINQHLHAAQLLKHLLGLLYENRAGGKSGFELIYLWLDVPGPEASKHRQELAEFQHAADSDGIRFRPMPCQEFILRLLRHRSRFPAFVDYLTDRYL
jgi:hypothetical protein